MVNFPTSLDSFTNPTSTDALSSVTVPHATQHANVNDAIEALEAKVGINSSADTNSLDYKVANKQDIYFVKSSDFTAANDGNYTITATCAVTDPSPAAGKGFICFIRNGTATIGGIAYSTAGSEVRRVYHSWSWATYVIGSGGGGGFLEKSIPDEPIGPAVVGILGSYTSTRTGTLGSIRLVSSSLPVGSNVIAELRKNSTTSGNVLSATLQITTSESLTNTQYIGTTVSSFSSTAIAAGDVFYVYLTSVGSTTPASNVRALLYTT